MVLYLTDFLKPVYKLMIGQIVCNTVLLLCYLALLPSLNVVMHLFRKGFAILLVHGLGFGRKGTSEHRGRARCSLPTLYCQTAIIVVQNGLTYCANQYFFAILDILMHREVRRQWWGFK